MSRFIAGQEVEPMEFDFSAFDGPTGTIPEPTQDQVDEYYIVLDDLRYQIRQRLTGQVDTVDLEEGVKGLDLDALREKSHEGRLRIYQAVQDVTSKALTVEQLDALPHRVSSAFAGWLFGELSPKDSMNGTNI